MDDKENDEPSVGQPKKRVLEKEAASIPTAQGPGLQRGRYKEDKQTEEPSYRPRKRERKEEEDVPLAVKYGDRLLQVMFKPSDTIGTIKAKIFELEPALPKDRQVLWYRSRSVTLGAYTLMTEKGLRAYQSDEYTLSKSQVDVVDYHTGRIEVVLGDG